MLIFTDVETTGPDPKADYLCQLAYKMDKTIFNKYFKPPIPVSFDTMAVNHITNDFLTDKPTFKDSGSYIEFQKILNDKKNILIAHNANFDVSILENEGLIIPHYICTYKLIMFIDKELKIPKYNLQYLRYYLNIQLNEKINAHDALGDILVLEQIFYYIYHKFQTDDSKTISDILNQMINISTSPLLLKKMMFGKHKDKLFTWIAKHELGYLEWMANQSSMLKNNKDLEYTINYYLNN